MVLGVGGREEALCSFPYVYDHACRSGDKATLECLVRLGMPWGKLARPSRDY